MVLLASLIRPSCLTVRPFVKVSSSVEDSMSQLPDDISRNTLKRLVARALELDERRADRISLSQAREIARELGITEAAWDTAVAEQRRQVSAPRERASAGLGRLHAMLVAPVAFGAGALGGWLNGVAGGEADVAYGALLVLGGFELWTRARRASPRAAEASLDIWWLAIPAGMLVAFGGIRTDPVLFALCARLGTAVATTLIPRLLRSLRARRPPWTSTA